MRMLLQKLKKLVDEFEDKKEKDDRKKGKEENKNPAATVDDRKSVFPDKALTHINTIIKADRTLRKIASGPRRPDALNLKRLSKNNREKADDLNEKMKKEAENLLKSAQQLQSKHIETLKDDLDKMLDAVEGKTKRGKLVARFEKIFDHKNSRLRTALLRVLRDTQKALDKADKAIVQFEDENDDLNKDIEEGLDEFDWPEEGKAS